MRIKNKNSRQKKTVFVAMSGGVDSSVAAALLQRQGYRVVGVTMCFDLNYPDSRKPSCCGAEGIASARRVAGALDIPHYVLSFSRELEDKVIRDFIEQYISGATPNPCIRCNQYLKFETLLSKAKSLGADFLATGHYARIEFNRRKRRFELKKGCDKKKDQSYFLYTMRQEILPSVLFPLGAMTKTQVRALARKFGLQSAERPGSQDICFIPPGGYRRFLKSRLKDSAARPGPIKDENGQVVGEHQGIAFYTVGQREGLGLSLGRPVYVYHIDKETSTLFVGNRDRLDRDSLTAGRVNFIDGTRPKRKTAITARIRYNQPEVKGALIPLEDDSVKVEFDRPVAAVTRGQAVVFYKRDVVMGGGTIL